MTLRPVLTRHTASSPHWVGDGFLTRSLLPYRQHAQDTSPFLLAGYNPPMHFAATDRPRGVGLHPHRGFETVTIVFQGGVTHRDTMGNSGSIGPGDVQWMTAARGVQHEEFHSDLINAHGGTLEMVQLWVNLPARAKMQPPRYQSLGRAQIPEVSIGQASRLRVIAGAFGERTGPAETVTPLHLWDVRLAAGERQRIALPEGLSVSVALLSGRLALNDGPGLEGPGSLVFSTGAGEIRLKAEGGDEAHYLVMAGKPLGEPIAMGGPFVMNSEAELHRAWEDFQAGRF